MQGGRKLFLPLLPTTSLPPPHPCSIVFCLGVWSYKLLIILFIRRFLLLMRVKGLLARDEYSMEDGVDGGFSK